MLSYGVKDGPNDPDWSTKVPPEHWRFLESTVRYWEDADHIYVHACLAPDLDLHRRSDWMLFWERFERLAPHKSGKRVICGHTAQHSGRIRESRQGSCIDTGAGYGGWLTCLETETRRFWQANEQGETRQGQL